MRGAKRAGLSRKTSTGERGDPIEDEEEAKKLAFFACSPLPLSREHSSSTFPSSSFPRFTNLEERKERGERKEEALC